MRQCGVGGIVAADVAAAAAWVRREFGAGRAAMLLALVRRVDGVRRASEFVDGDGKSGDYFGELHDYGDGYFGECIDADYGGCGGAVGRTRASGASCSTKYGVTLYRRKTSAQRKHRAAPPSPPSGIGAFISSPSVVRIDYLISRSQMPRVSSRRCSVSKTPLRIWRSRLCPYAGTRSSPNHRSSRSPKQFK